MTERTDRLAKIDQWQNLRERFAAGWMLGVALITSLLLITEATDDNWESLPLALIFGIAGGLALALAVLFLGAITRWQTLPRALTLPTCVSLILAGASAAAFCLMRTSSAPRAPIGTAELQHAPIYLTGLALAVFGAVNWPARPRR
ncbi:MAG: hypothetical protein ACO23N_02545 [Opitutales bacterium]|jgi:hypothetical protein